MWIKWKWRIKNNTYFVDKKDLHMTETGKVFLRYLYKHFWWKVIHHRKKLFRIIHKRAFETSMKKLKFVIFTNAPCKGLNSNIFSLKLFLNHNYS